MTLSRKITLYFGLFLFLVVLGFMGLNYFIMQHSVARLTHTNLQRSVESINKATQSMLNASIRNYLRGVVDQDIVLLKALNQKVLDGILSESQAKDTFQEYVKKQSIGESGYTVALRSEGDRIFLDIHPFMRGQDCSSNKGCQDWISRKNGYSEYDWKNPHDNTIRKKVGYIRYFKPWNWVIGATSYRDEFTKLVKIEDVRRMISSFKVLDRGYFFVCDGKLNMLIHPELAGQNVSDVKNSEGVYTGREIPRHENQFFYYKHKTAQEQVAQERFSFVKKINDYNWYLVATGYVEDMYRPVRQLARIGYILIVVTAGLLAALIAVFSKNLTRHLGLLLSGVIDFNQSRKVFKMPIRSVAEINQLGHAMEETTQSLLKSEEENADLLNELNSILNLMPSILAVTDSSGKVLFWNEQAEAFSGIPQEKALGKPITDMLSQFGGLEKWLPHIRNCTPYQETRLIQASDTQKQHFDVSLYPISDAKHSTVIRIDDITERVQMEEVVLQSKKMDAVGNLAGGIAHDFNNMLGGILGAVELLEDQDDHSTQSRHFMKMIRETTLRAAGLTQNLLSFSRKQIRKSEAIHVHTAISDAITLLKRSIDRKIVIETVLQATQDSVEGDYSELQSIFLNLGINAAHAMPDGGHLVFKTSSKRISQGPTNAKLRAGEYISIAVIDTGTGIPPHVMEKVFEPFFTTKPPGKGTGLGLSSVYGTVMQQNGDVTISSKVGEGTTVSVLLPLSKANEDHPPVPASKMAKGSGTILVMDDEEILRHIADVSLKRLGYNTLLAEDGQEGLALFQKHIDEIDLVLLDMIMPVVSGKECLEEIKKIKPDVPVVIVSGFSKDNELTTLQEQYDFGFLTKPYNMKVLSRVISKYMKQSTIQNSQALPPP